MNALPFDVGRFRLVDMSDTRESRAVVGHMMAKSHAEFLSSRGDDWVNCGYSQPEELMAIHFGLYVADELVGSWIPYKLEPLDGGGYSAMIAPVLPSEPASDEWLADVSEIAAYFLANEIELDGGGVLNISEWRFPLAERGADPAYEWFGPRSDNQGRLDSFLAAMGAAGVLVTQAPSGVPSIAVLEGE